jgi:tetratricopeptide (TPR) repeat protein
MNTPSKTFPAGLTPAGILSLLLLCCSGCQGPALNSARANFYMGRLDRAEKALEDIPEENKNTALYLMERGMIHQANHAYSSSSTDWLQAAATIERLEYVSMSKQTASLVINNSTVQYTGMPYERTLLRAFLAKNYIATADWDGVAVESRNIVKSLQDLDGFPEDPYSRYIAGLGFELINDQDGARMEYERVKALLPQLNIDPVTGHFGPDQATAPDRPHELICLVAIGRIPRGEYYRSYPPLDKAPYVEIYDGSKKLGRSYTFVNTGDLLNKSLEQTAAMRIAKGAARIAAKEGISEAISRENEQLGELIRLILYAFEQPDTRRWETLPLWLGIARVPCPEDVKEVRVVFKNSSGHSLQQQIIREPLQQKENLHLTFCRDLVVVKPPDPINTDQSSTR